MASLRAWVAMCVSVCLSSGGCTLAGAGIGAGIDAAVPGPYEKRAPTAYVSFKPRQRVMVWLGNANRIEGRYLGATAPTPSDPETYLYIDAGAPPLRVAASQIKALAVEVSGNGWLYGGLLGLVVDVGLVVIAAVSVANQPLGPWHSQSGCWC